MPENLDNPHYRNDDQQQTANCRPLVCAALQSRRVFIVHIIPHDSLVTQYQVIEFPHLNQPEKLKSRVKYKYNNTPINAIPGKPRKRRARPHKTLRRIQPMIYPLMYSFVRRQGRQIAHAVDHQAIIIRSDRDLRPI